MPTYVQILIRAAFTYVAIFITTRLMGKREISQLSFFDYVIGISIGTIAGSMAIDTTKSFANLSAGLVVFGLLQIITAFISLKSTSFRKVSDGTKTLLIKNGKIIEENLRKERLNIDELAAKLRDKNVFTLADVEFAYLEVDGKVSVLKKPNAQALTPSDLKLSSSYKGIGDFIIREGEIQEEELRQHGLTRSWLMSKLSEKGIFNLSKVNFAQVDDSGTLFIDLYDYFEDDPNKDTANMILLAKLNKVHSDFLTYYTETNNTSAKDLYKSCAENIEHVTQYFQSYLRQQANKDEVIHHHKSQ